MLKLNSFADLRAKSDTKNLNTSHVKVKHTNSLYNGLYIEFKYISC